MKCGKWAVLLAGAAALAVMSGCSGMAGNTASLSGTPTSSAAAGVAVAEDVCELCLKPLVEQFEVILASATDPSEHRYRCIHCALVAARDMFTGDLQLQAKSAVEGAAVELVRAGGEWRATPSSARVLAVPEVNDECLEGHVVFADEEELKAYVAERPGLSEVAPFGAEEVERILSAGKPAAPGEATCPVSGQTVEVGETTPWTVYEGEVYYFCCKGCKPRFLANADAYLKGEGPKPPMMMGSGSCGGSCGGSHGADSGGGCGGASGHSPSEGGDGEEPAQKQEQGEPGS